MCLRISRTRLTRGSWDEFDDFKRTQIDTGKVGSGDAFGTRAFLKNNYLYRMAAGILGIYGNSKAEALRFEPAFKLHLRRSFHGKQQPC
jgi:hypothetical protein